jgi:disulfide oxidoreductase YuzD
MPFDDVDRSYGEISDLTTGDIPPERDLAAELFNKRSIKDVVANIEKELGLNPQAKKAKNVKRHNVIVSPSRDQDAELLDKILNNDDIYRIIMWKDTWTVHGDYRIFLIYEEQLDKKKDEHDTAK